MPKKRRSGKTIKKRVPRESLKKDVLRLEKKIVDLEIGATELKEKLEKVDLEAITEKLGKIDPEAISGLGEKVENVDSLMMVEQVGIREIKKMMEDIQTKLATPPQIPPEAEEKLKTIETTLAGMPSVPPDLEEKLGKIEKKLVSHSLSMKDLSKRPPPPTIPPGLEDRIGKIERDISTLEETPRPAAVEIERLYDKLNDIEKDLSSLKLSTEGTLKSLYERLKTVEERKPVAEPGVDFDLLSSKINDQKSSIDRIFKKMAETDMKLVGLDKKSEMLEVQMRESAPEIIRDEIKLNRKDLAAASARMDSLERVAREVLAEQDALRKTITKFESLERISLLGKDIEEKIERFKFIENEIRRLSSRVELIYDNIDKRLVKIKNIERRFEDVSGSLSNLSKEVDKNRAEVLVRATREDISKEVDEKIKTHLKDLNKILAAQEERVASVEGVKSGMEKRLSGLTVAPMEDLKKQLTDQEKRISAVEVVGSGIEEKISQTHKVLSKMIASEIKPLVEKVDLIERYYDSLAKGVEGVKPEKFKKMVEELGSRMSEIDSRSFSKLKQIDENVNKRLEKIESAEKELSAISLRLSKLANDVEKNRAEILMSARKEEIDKILTKLNKTIKKAEPERVEKVLEEVNSRVAQIESRLASTEDVLKREVEELRSVIGKKIAEVKLSVPTVDKQVKEMIDKMIFLESRLGAIEKIMRETSKTQPVILE